MNFVDIIGHAARVRTYGDTGSEQIFGSVFLGSCMIKILFAYTRDTFCGSLDTEPVSWFWFADPYFLYRSQPC